MCDRYKREPFLLSIINYYMDKKRGAYEFHSFAKYKNHKNSQKYYKMWLNT